MKTAAAEERFEDAARVRDRISAVEHTVERQQIVTEKRSNRDVVGLARDGGEVEVQLLHVREGRVIGASTHSFSSVEVEDPEVMAAFLGQYFVGGAERQVPNEILVSVLPDDEGALAALLSERAGRKVTIWGPQRGAPRELVDLASRNADVELTQRLRARESVDTALEELREKLHLSTMPRRIECYDISNLAGTLAVGSRVVFVDGVPEKNDYRRYRIREAAAGDDLACMREVLQRRLTRRESEPLPDLLLVDGGRGQLGVVTALLGDAEVELDHAGIAKERDDESPSVRVKRGGGLKAERLFLPNRLNPVMLPPSSRGLLLLQRVRDEAHRFAIEFQRSLRQKIGMTSILEEIPGIGPRKRQALLKELGSLRRVREADEAALEAVTGLSARDAATVAGFFRALASAADPDPKRDEELAPRLEPEPKTDTGEPA